MGVSNTGISYCEHCGAQFRLFSIMNKDMIEKLQSSIANVALLTAALDGLIVAAM